MLDSPWLLFHPTRDWSLDATRMGLDEPSVDALDWVRVFAELEALEAGAIANADEGRQVGHYWLRDPPKAPTMGQARSIGEAREGVLAFVESVVSGSIAAADGSPFTDVLHIGIGGSALGPQLIVDALGGDGLRMHFLDNTDPDGIERVLRRLDAVLRTTLVVVVSKSGGTAETLNAMQLAAERFEERGLGWSSRAVAITGRGSRLDERAKEEGWIARFPMWDWVGGRTSVTSAVGLLPAALSGVDVDAFLEGAREMDEWTRRDSWRQNPAALLAACWHEAGKGRGERAMVVLPYRDSLSLMSKYLQQLVMESLGKRLDRQGRTVHQGLAVYGNKGSTDQHAYVQQLRDGRNDFFATFIGVLDDGVGSGAEVAPGATAGDFLQGFLLGTRGALADAGRPSLTLTLPRVDALEVGQLIALFERAVTLYASLIDINAYHQPGVEAGKKAATRALELATTLAESLHSEPQSTEQLANAHGSHPVDTLDLLRRLEVTGRARKHGHGATAQWSKP